MHWHVGQRTGLLKGEKSWSIMRQQKNGCHVPQQCFLASSPKEHPRRNGSASCRLGLTAATTGGPNRAPFGHSGPVGTSLATAQIREGHGSSLDELISEPRGMMGLKLVPPTLHLLSGLGGKEQTCSLPGIWSFQEVLSLSFLCFPYMCKANGCACV